MKKIEFKFDLDEKVRTCFDTKGLIVGLFYDESGNQYSVRTEDGDKWFKEKDLMAGWHTEPFEKTIKVSSPFKASEKIEIPLNDLKK